MIIEQRMDNPALLKKMQMIVRCLTSQIEALGMMIDHVTHETNHGTLGLTIGTHDIEHCVRQIDELLETRERLKRKLAKANQNYEGYLDIWSDGLLNSMDVT